MVLVARTIEVGHVRVGAEDNVVFGSHQSADPFQVTALVTSQRTEGAGFQGVRHVVSPAEKRLVLEARQGVPQSADARVYPECLEDLRAAQEGDIYRGVRVGADQKQRLPGSSPDARRRCEQWSGFYLCQGDLARQRAHSFETARSPVPVVG